MIFFNLEELNIMTGKDHWPCSLLILLSGQGVVYSVFTSTDWQATVQLSALRTMPLQHLKEENWGRPCNLGHMGMRTFHNACFHGHCLRNQCFLLKGIIQGFPGGTVVENLPANAADMGSSPGLGRSHMSRSNWAREPQLLSLRVWSLCSATREATIVRGQCTAMKSGPRLPQLEKALAHKRRPNTAKN